MAKEQDFVVVRRHIGDRVYAVGEIRTGTLADLKQLVPHVLQPVDGKADAALDNKAEGAAPENKGKNGRKADKGRKAATAEPAAEDPQSDPAATEAGEDAQDAQADPAETQAEEAAEGDEE